MKSLPLFELLIKKMPKFGIVASPKLLGAKLDQNLSNAEKNFWRSCSIKIVIWTSATASKGVPYIVLVSPKKACGTQGFER